MAHWPTIDFTHGYEACEGAGDEGFVCAINVVERKLFFECRNAEGFGDAQQIGAGDAGNAILAR